MTDAVTARPSAYQLILPPGWKQHPVRPGLGEKLYRHVEAVVGETQNHELMAQVRTATVRAVKRLAENGGIDIFIPENVRGGVLMPASLTTSLLTIGTAGIEPTVNRMARGRVTETVELHESVAYKWVAEANGTNDLKGLQSSVVYYLCPLPGESPDAAIVFAFGVLRMDALTPEYVEVLYLLFDAMMQSLVWIAHDHD